ncbi:uncharacterized protein [Physcomitrium patens]|uniref:EF-hand domain-containing protein n=1 Tax=Physcomitrium patens TaxID=3218 RepID=A0A7I4F218_PHYPA|nr:calcineurin subunit B type 1-like isoform X1 [Physcomitrium patens]|eukprot:XP_024390459.1 calcineurin subunit B type 1-like isoform X1 [Physcomitrella patens]
MGNSHSTRALSREEENRVKLRFEKVTGKDQPNLTPRKFNDLLGNPAYVKGLFNYIDKDGDGSVSCKELCEGIESFRASNTPSSKLRVLYNYYDSDHDGMISQSEVADAMRVASGEDLSNSQLEKLVHSIMETFDVDKDGFLNFKEFCCLMRNAGLQYNL